VNARAANSVQPYEQTNIWELAAKGDIRVFNKIMMVFGSLIKEINRLKAICDEKFVPAFISYGLFDEADEGLIQIQVPCQRPGLSLSLSLSLSLDI
jgi:hypothetical protein